MLRYRRDCPCASFERMRGADARIVFLPSYESPRRLLLHFFPFFCDLVELRKYVPTWRILEPNTDLAAFWDL